MKKFKHNLSLIVPFYNEEEGIVKRYKELKQYLTKNVSVYELIFVNDGSKDNSKQILSKAINRDKKTKLVSYQNNQGRGHAVAVGFKKAKGDLIGYIDSDLEIRPKYIGDCLKLIDKYDGVGVSKHHPKSIVNTTKKRRIASKVFNLWAQIILNSRVTDHQAGLKIYQKNLVKKVLSKTSQKGWLFDIEFLYHAQNQGFTIGQVPIKVSYGFQKIKQSMISGFLKSIFFVLKLRINNGSKTKN